MKTILVTGAAGFIGSAFCKLLLRNHPNVEVVGIDAFTYAGNPRNLAALAHHPRFKSACVNICNRAALEPFVRRADSIVNFAAETHVDRSILNANDFVETNIVGTYTLLDLCKEFYIDCFVQVSTDEVYGSVPEGFSVETDPIRPSSPYSASKASAEWLAMSYYHTHKIPVLITRGSNTYGPFQYPEKLIPYFISQALNDKPLKLYGDGEQIRDWISVADHCLGIMKVLECGQPGQAYNIGGGNLSTNNFIAKMILNILGKPHSLLSWGTDRPGHDHRYALCCDKLCSLGWEPKDHFEGTLCRVIQWYVDDAEKANVI